MSLEEARVRAATPADARACRAIYAPYVEDSAISFEEQVPSVQDVRERIETALRTHAWVVLELLTDPGPSVVGYAYAGPYKVRPAYRWSCEVSVYVARDLRGRGAGRALYLDLLARLAERGYLMAVAGMTLPNPASQALHRALGFEDVGTWRRIGFKRGAWHDVHWMQRPLADHEASSAPRDPA